MASCFLIEQITVGSINKSPIGGTGNPSPTRYIIYPVYVGEAFRLPREDNIFPYAVIA